MAIHELRYVTEGTVKLCALKRAWPGTPIKFAKSCSISITCNTLLTIATCNVREDNAVPLLGTYAHSYWVLLWSYLGLPTSQKFASGFMHVWNVVIHINIVSDSNPCSPQGNNVNNVMTFTKSKFSKRKLLSVCFWKCNFGTGKLWCKSVYHSTKVRLNAKNAWLSHINQPLEIQSKKPSCTNCTKFLTRAHFKNSARIKISAFFG